MGTKQLRPWKTLSKQVLLDHGKFLKVENHVVELPDGRIIPDWAWVEIPDAVIVLPMTPDGKFLCFRQTKYAVEATTLAPVGGMLAPGEAPLAAARRELREEMGCEAAEWVPLGAYLLDPNRGVATMHLFLALEAQRVCAPDSDDLEDQEIIELSGGELESALQAGEFKIISWSAVVALSLLHLSKKRSTTQNSPEINGDKQ